jgi:hypothetical protein
MARSPPPRPVAGREHGDGIETIVIRTGDDVLPRIGLAERVAAGPVLRGEEGAKPLAPVAAEDDGGDVLAGGGGERGAVLQQVRLVRDVGQARLEQRLQRALASLLEGAGPRLLAAALAFRLLDPPFE